MRPSFCIYTRKLVNPSLAEQGILNSHFHLLLGGNEKLNEENLSLNKHIIIADKRFVNIAPWSLIGNSTSLFI